MILVDSSVWIDYLALQGFADKNGFDKATKLPTSLTVLEREGQEVEIQAARNFRALRDLGVTIRKTRSVNRQPANLCA